jgi:hypothetical protein
MVRLNPTDSERSEESVTILEFISDNDDLISYVTKKTKLLIKRRTKTYFLYLCFKFEDSNNEQAKEKMI